MNIKIIILLAIGVGLKTVSHSLELQGDLASVASERLTYHLSALVMLLGAAACFIYAGLGIFRSFRKKKDDAHQ